MHSILPIRAFRSAFALVATLTVAACYPHFDWREARPDCAKGWCGFVASFPGKVTTATRDVPVGATRLPLSVSVVSVDDVTFAIGAFELAPGGDADAAQAVLERKLLDDVGASEPKRGQVVLHAADRAEVVASTFEADGQRGSLALHAVARFARRNGRLIEIFVVGPGAELSRPAGRQAVETFLTSVRLD